MITGHRPKKLWIEEQIGKPFCILDNSKTYHTLKNRMEDELIKIVKHHPFTMITGMALGVDLMFGALAVELKEVYDVELFCALPCTNQTQYWTPLQEEKYFRILDKADYYTHVTPGTFEPRCMQLRNQFMVDMCDYAIAVWDGSKSGGTADTVRRIKKAKKPLIIINPFRRQRSLF